MIVAALDRTEERIVRVINGGNQVDIIARLAQLTEGNRPPPEQRDED